MPARPQARTAPHQVVFIRDGRILEETELAVRIRNRKGLCAWLPKSQLGFYADGQVSVPRWLYDKKDL